MDDAQTRLPKFTLFQLLATVAVIAVVSAIGAAFLRRISERGDTDFLYLLVMTGVCGMFVCALIIGFGIPPLRSNCTKVATFTEALSHGIGATGVVGLMLVAIPMIGHAFKDYEAPLPEMTMLLITTSDTAIKYWYVTILLVPMLTTLDAGVFFLLHRGPLRRRWAARWSRVMTMLLFTTMMCLLVAILAPIFIP
jgi:hypothetical protein